jgi:hypothetical protein
MVGQQMNVESSLHQGVVVYRRSRAGLGEGTRTGGSLLCMSLKRLRVTGLGFDAPVELY